MRTPDTVHDPTLRQTLHIAKRFALLQENEEASTLDMLFALNLQNTTASIILKGLLQKKGARLDIFNEPFLKLRPALTPIDPEKITFSRPANKAIERASEEATLYGGFRNSQGKIEVASDHLLVALAEVETAETRGFLTRCGVRVESIREAVYCCFPS